MPANSTSNTPESAIKNVVKHRGEADGNDVEGINGNADDQTTISTVIRVPAKGFKTPRREN
jgi:hypothetical protein